MPYKIVCDSSSNLYTMEQVSFASVPLRIRTEEREYVDTPGLIIPEMVAYLRDYKGKSSTACPGVGDWLDAFGEAEGVFAVPVTAGLSGSYTAAQAAARLYQSEHPHRRVFVLNTLSAGPELTLLAEKLQELTVQGGSFEEICDRITAYQQHTHLIFSLESVNNFARNGRVSPVVAKVAGLLGIRIVGKASSEGTLQPLHKSRGEKKALEKLWDEMQLGGFSGGKVRIAHCMNPDAANRLADEIRTRFPSCDVAIQTCGGLCSYYAEQGGILVGFEDPGEGDNR